MNKFLLVAVLALCAVAATHALLKDDDLVLDKRIQYIVNNSDSTWVAGDNEAFRGMTLKEAKKLLGSKLDYENAAYKAQPVTLHLKAIPETFDASKQWANCTQILNIRDQQQCGSCWAFAATEAFADRVCIGTNGALQVELSPQELVSCDTTDYGCDGGYLSNAWAYLESAGVPIDACYPYTSGGGDSGTCTAVPPAALPTGPGCSATQAATYYKAKNTVNPTDEASIQTEIMTNGPVEAGFSVYEDFFNYKSGVYTHKSGGLAGGHAIKIIGWGVDKGVKYWIVNNSWGTSWGQNGQFWIVRGKDECGFERDVYAGLF